jgi:hypothetical protein
MTGWNLPPGCNVSDLPGNRPEDLDEERFWDALLDNPKTPDDVLPEEWWEDDGITQLVNLVREMAYNAGYGDGQNDMGMEIANREMDKEES